MGGDGGLEKEEDEADEVGGRRRACEIARRGSRGVVEILLFFSIPCSGEDGCVR